MANKMSRRAFTLLEMLIVIAIMLILVIATLPRIKYALDESKVRESSRQLNSYLSMAKARAATTGRPCGVWFIPEVVGDPNAQPPLTIATQFYLAEIPPPYSGDMTESTVVMTASSGAGGNDWLMNFTPAAASLTTLVVNGDDFRVRFDHKGPFFAGYRWPQDGNFYVKYDPTLLPPRANTSGYQYEIVRGPQRVGSPLSLPRGTCVDLTYSGFGNTGVNFFTEQNSGSGLLVNQSRPAVLVMFSSDGHVDGVSYRTWDQSQNAPRFVSGNAPGAIHLLVGRPEKAINFTAANPIAPGTNIVDNHNLWVSVGRLTGSVTTTENGFTNTPSLLPASPTFADYIKLAREYAITQDVKGGR
jgi:prepilin-type N-terminal cleavage/methylation domain-containing protein